LSAAAGRTNLGVVELPGLIAQVGFPFFGRVPLVASNGSLVIVLALVARSFLHPQLDTSWRQ
jgi:hypothetical protein